jgi:MerR family transcriptional regulator, copper efflux regulator
MSRRPLVRNFRDYLTVKEAARLLGVSRDTLRNWDRADKLKPVRHPMNRYRLYRREDLGSLLQQLTRAGQRSP